jgi:PAS domain S-box-containing protein
MTYESVFKQMGVEGVCVSAQGVRDFDAPQRCIGIVLDLTARAASGVEAIKEIRKTRGFERTPIVVITDAPVEIEEVPLVDCLLLPLAPDLLRNKVAMFLELSASEERYRGLLEHPTEYLFLLEAVRTAAGEIEDWRYIDANRNALRLLHGTRETLLGKRLSEVVSDRSERLIALCTQVLHTRSPQQYESAFGAAEFLTCMFPFGPNSVVASATDVTARNHADREVQRLAKALNAEKEWLLAALNSIHDEVYFTDPQGRYTYVNPAALREFGHVFVEGVPVEKIVSTLEVLRSDGTPRPIQEAPPLRALKGEVVNDEEQIVRVPRTGEFRYRQVSSAPVCNGEGNVIGSVSVVRDVTESKHAEARLREAVEQAQAAAAESRAALAAELSAMKRLHDLSTTAIKEDDQQALLEEILDATMELHAADFGTIRLFDVQSNTLRIAAHRGLEQRLADRYGEVHCRDAPMWAAAMVRGERVIIEDAQFAAYGFLQDLARPIGCRTIQSTPLLTAAGAPLGMLATGFVSPRTFSQNELRLTDLYARQAGIAIERKRAEAALVTARESADRANKAKSHFLRAASHDLRQPVQTLAMLNGILRNSTTDAPIQTIVRQQSEAIDTMAHLLDALLNISKLESGAVKPEISDFPVVPLLTKLQLEFSSLAASKGLELNIDSNGSPSIRSDPTLVGEILRNLLSNAVKFTPRGLITLRCVPDRETVRLEVTDTGVGIPREELPLIFSEFYQVGVDASVSRQGYGLGLGIVQRMASMLHAGIEVESEVGKGSRFSLIVPAGELDAADQKTAVRSPGNLTPAATSSTILLVEDHAAVRKAMELFFTLSGYRIVSAGSLDQTLAIIGESPRPELLITDFHLPGGITGSDVINSVRSVLGEKFPSIMISGDTSAEVSDLAHDAQVRFASKPIDPSALVSLVEELLGSRQS